MPGRLGKFLLDLRLRSSTYARHFRRAVANSGNLHSGEFRLQAQLPDFETRLASCRHLMENGNFPFFVFAAGQCLNSALHLAPVITETTGIRTWPTLGQLWCGSEPIFYMSERSARKLVGSETSLNALAAKGEASNFHVWITLETGAILDATIAATLRTMVGAVGMPDRTMFGCPETVLPGCSYVPLVVGQEMIERILAEAGVPPAFVHHIAANSGGG